MSTKGPDQVARFVLAGQRYELTRDDVEKRLAGALPKSISTHAVRVGGRWFPVRQAFELATGIPAGLFNSHAARRHLATLGLEIRGEVQPRIGSSATDGETRQEAHSVHASAQPEPVGWPGESRVQAAVIDALVSQGWHIVSQADTATKERGIDVVARRGDRTAGIEVKGFPSRAYADPRRQSETKPTQPSTQAGHWYSQAVLAAMRLRSRHPAYLSVIALPDFPRYRNLFAETKTSLDAADIHVWWVHPSGFVEGP